MSAPAPALVHLRSAGVSLVLDVGGPTLPVVLHWGRDLGKLDDAQLAAFAAATVPATPRGGLDAPWVLPLIATELDGWSGTPGVAGHRAGTDTVPRLELVAVELDPGEGSAGRRVSATAVGGGLQITTTVALDAHGVVHVDAAVSNLGDGDYDLAGLLPVMPLPGQAAETLDLTGRWCRERSPQRAPLLHGTRLRAGRRGRSGHDAPLLMAAGTPGFGFRSGEIWAVHVAWSGDAVHLVERLPEGAGRAGAVLGGGEHLRPGEVRLAPGRSYVAPTAVYAWSDAGLDGVSARLHAMVRARPGHPHSPRPVVLNVWEAVYFEHDLPTLTRLADLAARIGVERYVIDDGWFGSRRDDTSGLGDWFVATDVWPDGLGPIVDHVRSLGLQVGLWFEPEMANPDSDLVRAHPDWVLTPDAPAWRGQVALDLANPDVSAHLLERLDTLVGEYRLDFVKWDHNRDLHAARHDGRPGGHGQTSALYELLDALRARHPHLEIESCASGGGRVDLGILEHTDRVWTSDTNDALERQQIQRWTTLLLPPELLGAHVGPPRSHTTGRVLDLSLRCATALFGHAGLEWDLTSCTAEELDALTRWIALYKDKRALLHRGTVVRADLADPSLLLHGVVAPDRSEALYAFVRLATSPDADPGRVRLPGLDDARDYRVRLRGEFAEPSAIQRTPPPWTSAGTTLPGSVLGAAGLPLPALAPATAVVLEVVATR